MVRPVPVLIASGNRPLYLWACLDSLFRATRHPHRFVFVDMGSDDPLVPRVIEGFRRRQMFDEIVRMERDDPRLLIEFVKRHLDDWSPYFVYVESDVVVEVTEPCWLKQWVDLMDANPQLAMLGSAIDTSDFIDLDQAKALHPDEDEVTLRQRIKAMSSERTQNVETAGDEALFRPHNPAGRFMMLRTSPLREVGAAEDHTLHSRLRAAGYDTAIATRVRHRHLSLLHLYDYPDYDLERRNAYFHKLNE